LFGTTVGELNNANLLVAQTLAHTACVALTQQHPANPASVRPHLNSALTAPTTITSPQSPGA
jgi:hypothetical protein